MDVILIETAITREEAATVHTGQPTDPFQMVLP